MEEVVAVKDDLATEEVVAVQDEPMVESPDSPASNNNIKPGSILRVKSDSSICDKPEEDLQPDEETAGPPPVLPKQSWLLRLFESTLFVPSMAMTYLFKSKATF